MKRILTFLVPFLFSAMSVFSQNTNPYLIFGYNSEIEYKLPMDKLFRIDNADTVSEMKTIAIDFESSLVYLLGKYDVVLDTINLNPDDVLIWLSVDPMVHKYPQHSPYVYCSNNPLKYIDPNGREWVDTDGNKVSNHSNIKAYIFYDHSQKGFGKQSKQMAASLEAKYGKGSVAMSNVTTEAGFSQDWRDMASPDIREVNLNYHGGPQALTLNWRTEDYITSTGTGFTQGNREGTEVNALQMPKGNISNAQLNINSCRSMSRCGLEGGTSLGAAFAENFNFSNVRGTHGSVNYNSQGQPTTQWYYGFDWTNIPQSNPNAAKPRNGNFIRVGGAY